METEMLGSAHSSSICDDQDLISPRGVIRLVLASETAFHRDAVSAALKAYDDVRVIGATGDIYAALVLLERERPDALFLDSPSEALLKVLAANPVNCALVLKACQASAPFRGLQEHTGVGMHSSLDEAHAALVFAARRHQFKSTSRAGGSDGDSLRAALQATLTGREREVLQLLARGCTNKDIAEACCISLATVKNHVHSILGKLGLQRRSQVVTLAI